jgi:hypothetical protein
MELSSSIFTIVLSSFKLGLDLLTLQSPSRRSRHKQSHDRNIEQQEMISERNKSAGDILDMLSSWLDVEENETDSNRSKQRVSVDQQQKLVSSHRVADSKDTPQRSSNSFQPSINKFDRQYDDDRMQRLDPFTEGRLLNMQLFQQQVQDGSEDKARTRQLIIDMDDDKSDDDNSVLTVSSHRKLLHAKSQGDKSIIPDKDMNELDMSNSKDEIGLFFENLFDD